MTVSEYAFACFSVCVCVCLYTMHTVCIVMQKRELCVHARNMCKMSIPASGCEGGLWVGG